MLFLEHIDSIHEEKRTEFGVAEDNLDFQSIIPVQIEDAKHVFNFEIRKNRTSMLFFVVGQQRIYFSDSDIIKTLIDMPEEDTRWYLSQFVALYSGNKKTMSIVIDQQHYLSKGISMKRENKDLHLFTDSIIPMNYFSAMLSFVFAKDECWGKKTKRGFFGKTTLCKFISLIDYYKFNSQRSETFLDSIGLNYSKTRFNPDMDTNIFKKKTTIKMFDISQYK